MKKIIIVCLALSMVAFFAAGSFAGIAGSRHDLSSTGMDTDGTAPRAGGAVDAKNEICVFCHTPHNSNTAVTDAPLWNKDLTAESFTPYSSDTLDATMPATGVDGVTGVSKLCMSCHDGATAVNAFGGTTSARFQGENDVVLGTDAPFIGSLADLGTGLAASHPVSFTYNATLVGLDDELKAVTELSGLGGTISEDMLFGASSDQLECASCHDVHDDTNAPFLVKANTNSALCLTCHDK